MQVYWTFIYFLLIQFDASGFYDSYSMT